MHPDTGFRKSLRDSDLHDGSFVGAASALHDADSGSRGVSAIDAGLAIVIEAWPHLSEQVRQLILSSISSVRRSRG